MMLYCFAGPNGSGKSTLFSKIVSDNPIDVPFINADDISRREEFSDLTNMKSVDKKITEAPTISKR